MQRAIKWLREPIPNLDESILAFISSERGIQDEEKKRRERERESKWKKEMAGYYFL